MNERQGAVRCSGGIQKFSVCMFVCQRLLGVLQDKILFQTGESAITTCYYRCSVQIEELDDSDEIRPHMPAQAIMECAFLIKGIAC